MTYHIARNGTPVNESTYATIEEIIAFATAPAWAGAPTKEITMINESTYKIGGMVYNIVSGENPKVARAAARTAMLAQPKPRNNHRQYQSTPG